jgi:hypothetical protein
LNSIQTNAVTRPPCDLETVCEGLARTKVDEVAGISANDVRTFRNHLISVLLTLPIQLGPQR